MPDLFVVLKDYGKLYIDKVLFEASYPILFTCVNKEKTRFLCVCCQNNASGKKWLITKTEADIIVSMLRDEITIRDAFLQFSDVRISLFRNKDKERIERHNSDWETDSIYLPKAGECIDADDDEFAEEIAYYERNEFPAIPDNDSDIPSSTQRYELKMLILYLAFMENTGRMKTSYAESLKFEEKTYNVLENAEYKIYQDSYPMIA